MTNSEWELWWARPDGPARWTISPDSHPSSRMEVVAAFAPGQLRDAWQCPRCGLIQRDGEKWTMAGVEGVWCGGLACEYQVKMRPVQIAVSPGPEREAAEADEDE